MTSSLVLTGGPGHPASASADALSAVLGDEVECFSDVHEGLAALDPDRHDLLVVNALAFTMQADKYDAIRAEQAVYLTDDGRRSIERWVAARRPILAVHTAVICFDDWPRWGELLGGAWDWARSWHPDVGPMTVDVGWPGVGPVSFVVEDEHYRELSMAGDVEIVATVGDEPVAWRRDRDGWRVACSLLGHDARSLDVPQHRDLLRTCVSWLLEEPCPT